MSTLRTNEELVAEIQKWNNTEENKVQLYRQNRGLIVKYAKNYMNDRTDEDELQDYLSEGYFAVERACNYYDPEKGAPFATILGYYLQVCFSRYTRESLLVGIPANLRTTYVRYGRVQTTLLTEKGEAAETEIAEKCNLTKKKAETVMAAKMFSVIKSLDEPILQPDGGEGSLAEIIADNFDLEKTSVQKVTDEQIRETMWECVGEMLTEKQMEVLKMHFQDELGVSQIAKARGLSRQAVSRMLISSMKKLKKSKELKKLYESL